jgi:DNA repair photolyase
MDYDPEQDPLPQTQFFRDRTSSIITYNDSSDVGFEASINPYRGCEHGCIYCYARPFHEYLGLSSGLDFETKIMVKEDAPGLLRKELSSPKWKPQMIAISGVTDCYQPVERRLKITRGCLEVLAEFRNPVGIVTKNALVTRDVDLLAQLARHRAAAVFVSLTTLDAELRKVMEPRTSPPAARLAAIKTLSEAGIPVGVLIGPVIPGLTDHEIPALVEAAAQAGARAAGYIMLRLPHAVAPLFDQWLTAHFPGKKTKCSTAFVICAMVNSTNTPSANGCEDREC